MTSQKRGILFLVAFIFTALSFVIAADWKSSNGGYYAVAVMWLVAGYLLYRSSRR